MAMTGMLAAMLLVGCGGKDARPVAPKKNPGAGATPRETVMNFFNAAAAGDGEAMAACYKAPPHVKPFVKALATQARLMIEFRRKMLAAYGPGSLGDLAPVIKDPREVEKILTIVIDGAAATADTGGADLNLVQEGGRWLILEPAHQRLTPEQVKMLVADVPMTDQAVRNATALIGQPGQTAASVVAAFKREITQAIRETVPSEQ